jgi:hypothetical protein
LAEIIRRPFENPRVELMPPPHLNNLRAWRKRLQQIGKVGVSPTQSKSRSAFNKDVDFESDYSLNASCLIFVETFP